MAGRIRKWFNLPETDVVSRPMGSSGVDVMMSDRALKTLPLSIECKNTKSFPSLSALDQSKENRYEDTTPVACWKPPRKGMEDTIIYMRLEDFLKLWKEHNEDSSPRH